MKDQGNTRNAVYNIAMEGGQAEESGGSQFMTVATPQKSRTTSQNYGGKMISFTTAR